MSVTLDKVPRTPAEVARAVLDAIEAHPGNFDMGTWVTFDAFVDYELAPTDNLCGTTLCAAGWIAHVTGWTIMRADNEVLVVDRWGEPDDWAVLYAEKDGERRHIDDVAEEALNIEHRESFWLASEEEAIERLREIAGRGVI